MTRFRQRLLTACVLLTLATAQLFGLHRGYLCDCGGIAQLTQQDHCHGPHSAACHEHQDPCHSNEAHDDEHPADTHEHEAVVESLLAQSTGSSVPLTPPSLQLVAILPAWLSTPVMASHPPPGRPPAVTEVPMPDQTWPSVLAHRIILRV